MVGATYEYCDEEGTQWFTYEDRWYTRFELFGRLLKAAPPCRLQTPRLEAFVDFDWISFPFTSPTCRPPP